MGAGRAAVVKLGAMLLGRSRHLPVVAGLLASAIALSSSVGHAQSTSDELGRRHFESGVAYLEESDYDSAITAFQKAYDLSKRPEILLNLATVHERRADLPSALAALRAYLVTAPGGEHAEAVKLRIQNLEKRLEEQEKAQTAPEPAPAPPPPAPPKTAPPPPVPAPSPTAEVPSRLPAFISLGVGGLLGGGALATGLIAKAKYDDAENTCGHACSQEQVSSSRTFAMTSTVLTGAAALGIGLGVVLLLTTPESETELGKAAPHWDVALGPHAAAASAAWSF